MIAVDTNILVRLIVEDDEAQVVRALALAEHEPFFIGYSVLCELDWVLQSRYDYDRRRIVAAVNALTELIEISFVNADDVRWALDCHARAGELADYLHMASAREIGRFASFENKLKRAGPNAPVQVVMP